MLEVGWSELVVIGVVALIVIGPKDLPEMFRTMGRFTAKMRAMARDFQRAMDDAAKDAGVADVARDLKTATSAKSLGLEAVKSAATKFEQWDPLKGARPGATPAATPATPAAATPAVASPAPAAATAAAAVPAAAVASPIPANLSSGAAAGQTALSPDAALPAGVLPADAVAPVPAAAPPSPAVTAAAGIRAAASGEGDAKPAPKPRKPRASAPAKAVGDGTEADAAKPARKSRSTAAGGKTAADTVAKALSLDGKAPRSPGRRRTKKAEDQE